MRFKLALVAAILVPATLLAQTTTVDFEDLSLPGPNTFYNGSDLAGGFISRGVFFNNSYNSVFQSWSGWSYSNVVDVTTPGFINQYAAYHLPSGGGDGSPKYGVAYNFSVGDARVLLPSGHRPLAMRVTNTTYAALSMLNGDSFAKKFGGPSGNDPDWFLLTIQGRDAGGFLTGTVDFYLADYRFTDPAQDYIISQWTTVNLQTLPENTVALTFQLTSTDVGSFGMNTPAYFAMDNLQIAAIPEPGVLALAGLAITGGVVGGWRQSRRLRGRNRRQARGAQRMPLRRSSPSTAVSDATR
jgi:hypothetical protein